MYPAHTDSTLNALHNIHLAYDSQITFFPCNVNQICAYEYKQE
jgi:hypothetical protein